MAISKFSNVKIKGICCGVPNNPIKVTDLGKENFNENDIKKVCDLIGVETLYYAKEGQTASDIGYMVAERLLSDLNWDRESIDGLIFVSQTPDYILPATSCILQDRLKLSKDCVALDINLGCSAYIYGLWLANQFISTKSCKRVLLIVGDIISGYISPKDKSTALIFGDGVSATCLEYCEDARPTTFVLKTDGSGANSLIIPAGSSRKPISDNTKILYKDEDGNVRNEENLYMNGMDIFGFAIREVPKIINEVIVEHGWTRETVDKLLLHQANNYMLKFIAQKSKIPIDKVPLNIDVFGNTGGASIPFLICDKIADEAKDNVLNVIMSGFGVGLSWGAVAMTLSDLYCSNVLYI